MELQLLNRVENQNLPQRHNTPTKNCTEHCATANFLLPKPPQEQTMLIKNKILLIQSSKKEQDMLKRDVTQQTEWLRAHTTKNKMWPIRLN